MGTRTIQNRRGSIRTTTTEDGRRGFMIITGSEGHAELRNLAGQAIRMRSQDVEIIDRAIEWFGSHGRPDKDMFDFIDSLFEAPDQAQAALQEKGNEVNHNLRNQGLPSLQDPGQIPEGSGLRF